MNNSILQKKVHNSGRVRSLSINNILTPLFAFRNYWQIIYTMRKLSENNKIVNICMYGDKQQSVNTNN